jgi:hypothetical protein
MPHEVHFVQHAEWCSVACKYLKVMHAANAACCMAPMLLSANTASQVWVRSVMKTIGLHHPLDGVTNPEYKLLHFIQLKFFFAKRRGT